MFATMSIMNSARTESLVGINIAEQDICFGACQSMGAQRFQCRVCRFDQSGTYSKIVSSGSQVMWRRSS